MTPQEWVTMGAWLLATALAFSAGRVRGHNDILDAMSDEARGDFIGTEGARNLFSAMDDW